MLLLMAGWQNPPAAGCDFELHLGGPDGELAGSGQLNTPITVGPGTGIPVVFSKALQGKQTVYLTYKRQAAPAGEDPGMISLRGIQFQ